MMARARFAHASALALSCSLMSPAVHAEPVVTQHPALSADSIAFTMGGDIWLMPRSGGEAHKVTSSAGVPTTSASAFSPDGKMLAFSASYGGDVDVYVMSTAGGQPRRLTFDGAADEVVGWSADGRDVHFRSTRDTFYPQYGLPRVFAVARDGGPARALPYPVAYTVAANPEGGDVALEPMQYINLSWKNYRGGDQRRILLVDPQTLAQRDLPGPLGNDHDPMWFAGQLYFISDRDGRSSLYRFDPATKAVTRLFDPGPWDIKDAALGPGGIVFSQLDGVSLLDLATGSVTKLAIRPIGDLPRAMPSAVDLAGEIMDAAVSDAGEAAFEAHGRILTVDEQNRVQVFGDSGHTERSPSFSRPGLVGAFSDASGINQLVLRDTGSGKQSAGTSFRDSAYFSAPTWSPDGRRVAFLDLMQNVWIGEVGHPPRRIDSERRTVARMAWAKWNVSWNHDATKLAYSRTLDNGLSAVFVWSSDDDRIEQVTPSDVDAQNPAWDADGKRLWFTASDNTPPAQAYLDQTAKMRPPILRRVFWTQAESTGWRHPEALALPSRRYEGVYPQSAPGKLLLVETKLPPGEGTFSMAGSQQVSILDANAPAPKPEVLVEGVEGFYPGDLYEHFTSTLRVSSDANTLLYRKAGEWFVDRLDAGHNVEHRALALTDAKVTVDPRAEWRAMFGDAFRQLAYLLHDPAHPPRDFAAWKAHYEPLVGGIASREDLTYVLEDVLGELHLSHADVAPPQFESPSLRTPTGNLAADFAIDKGRYRIVRVYHAAMFGIGADSVAPLDVPALAAKPGDLVVSIGDRKVSADRDLAEYLQETAGKVTRICLTADGEKAQRCANVTPVANDAALRFAAWLAERQKIVDRLGGGRVGYLHASDTVESGMAEFNRARYAQNDRQGFVLDVRFNSGGFAADYFIQMLTAPLLGRWQMPQGRNATTPGAWLGGPKAMVTNAYCGSGCDTYAYYFGKMGIGPIVGTPTWGGVAGSGGGPMLLDGGWITVPQYAMTDVEGRYALEGQAVQPGIPVDLTLQDMAAGRDPQLERAVLEVEAGIDAKRP